ncbi:hypothetical protein MNVI_09470 [Mycobacterium noviomagense]|uniref:SpoVT-AbrB domain-containing protein n=1 Tax=Mycobacterium noviomagense TaxID=459858 RepID=A0A7I7PAM8_9MYCO|nr:hypothetical protein BST37_09375 [Mycobacterium noviomagense]BBY05629.1 hypothetical protein MNVI_09470 [Mycobacterium noviomagense]
MPSYVMKLSRNGQVSIPADTRARWQTDRLLVVDFGDRVVMRPMPHDPLGDLSGKYPRHPSSDDARRRARADQSAAERRKRA